LRVFIQNNLEKQRQAKSTEVETLSKFMPYLSGTDEPGKKAALLAMRRISSTEFMTQIAFFYLSAAAVGALQAVVALPSATTDERSLASAALTALGLRNPSAEQVIDDGSSSEPAYWIFSSWLPGPGTKRQQVKHTAAPEASNCLRTSQITCRGANQHVLTLIPRIFLVRGSARKTWPTLAKIMTEGRT
jgi:hypothetical protein